MRELSLVLASGCGFVVRGLVLNDAFEHLHALADTHLRFTLNHILRLGIDNGLLNFGIGLRLVVLFHRGQVLILLLLLFLLMLVVCWQYFLDGFDIGCIFGLFFIASEVLILIHSWNHHFLTILQIQANLVSIRVMLLGALVNLRLSLYRRRY
jgi:hypothetical protein